MAVVEVGERDEWSLDGRTCNINSGVDRAHHVPCNLRLDLCVTVTPKSVTITNLKLGREAPRNHPWESRFSLVGPNIVQTLGYKPIPGSRDSAQGPPRYNSFKTGTPL